MKSELDKSLLNALIMFMRKLLDSDWRRAVKFKCNTSANYTSKFRIMKFSKPIIARQELLLFLRWRIYVVDLKASRCTVETRYSHNLSPTMIFCVLDFLVISYLTYTSFLTSQTNLKPFLSYHLIFNFKGSYSQLSV